VASTYTPNLALEIPAHSDYASTGWDNPMDNSLRALDTAYGGELSLAVSGGTHVLTTTEASNPILFLNGTLGSDQYVYYPGNVGGRRVIIPDVNLNGHTLYVRGNGGADATGVYFWISFGIPYPIIVTPGRVYWDYGGAQPGTIVDLPLGFAGNGWLPCDGRWVNMGLHDLLYDTIGGTWGVSGSFPSGLFKLPDYRGTVTAMADQIGTVPGSGPYAYNAGNRGILNSWGVTTFAGEANHQLSVAEMPAHNHADAGHGHGGSQDAHAHNVTIPGTFGGGLGQYGPPVPLINQASMLTQTDTRQPGVYVGTGYANIQNNGGSNAHNNVQPTNCTMKVIKW
jgi:microcystin-dependent protein